MGKVQYIELIRIRGYFFYFFYESNFNGESSCEE